MKGWPAVIAALTVLAAGCGSSAPSPAPAQGVPADSAAVTPPPSAPPPPSPAPSPDLAATCTLGYVSAGQFLALTPANEDDDSAASVKLTNTGSTGVTLTGFSIAISDQQGEVYNTQDASTAPDLPEFLPPAYSYTAVIDLSELAGTVSVPDAAFQKSTCAIVGQTGS